MEEEVPASEESEDMAISPSSRGTSAETGKTGTWKLVAEEAGDWTVGEDTGEVKTDNTDVIGTDDGTGDGTVETGADVGTGVDGTVETGGTVETDGTVETGADTEVETVETGGGLDGQCRATCPGCRHFRHKPEYRQSRGR